MSFPAKGDTLRWESGGKPPAQRRASRLRASSPCRGRTAATSPWPAAPRLCGRTDGRSHHPMAHVGAPARAAPSRPGTHRVAQRRPLAEHRVPHGRERAGGGAAGHWPWPAGRRSAGLPPGSPRPPAPLLVTPARSPPPAVPTPRREPAAPRQSRAAAAGGGSRPAGGAAVSLLPPSAVPPRGAQPGAPASPPRTGGSVPGSGRPGRTPTPARGPPREPLCRAPARPAAPGKTHRPPTAPGGEEPGPAGEDLKVKERGTKKT